MKNYCFMEFWLCCGAIKGALMFGSKLDILVKNLRDILIFGVYDDMYYAFGKDLIYRLILCIFGFKHCK